MVDTSRMGTFRALHNLCRGSEDRDNRRSAGRILVESVKCAAGEITDLSATGARFETKQPWVVGERATIDFELLEKGTTLSIPAKCVWSKKSGRKHVVGVEFSELTAEQRKTLTRLAMSSARSGWGAPKRQANDVNWVKLEEIAEREGSSSDAA